MNIQYRDAVELFRIEEKELSIDTAIEFFAKFGYEYIYVEDQGKLLNILTYKNINSLYTKNKETLNSVFSVENCRSFEEAQKLFISNPGLNTIAITDNGELIGEYSNMVEPPLQNRITMDLLALRNIDLFSDELEIYLSQYKSILLIASEKVSKIFKSNFKSINFRTINSIKDYEDLNHDLILDFLYGKRLLKKYNTSIKTENFIKIVDNIMFNKVRLYCIKNNINLRFYKTPKYEKMSCINKLEKEIIDQKIPTNVLLGNNEVVSRFTTSAENYKFVSERTYNNSLRYDNIFYYSQTDCASNGCNVRGGYRKVSSNLPNVSNNVYICGQCNMFGMFVSDEETLQSLLQNRVNNGQFRLNILNPSGMHGNSPFNIYLRILHLNLKANDTIVIIDIFLDLAKRYQHLITDMTSWFNKNKRREDIYYFNYPEHCNVKAYEIMANYIYKDLVDIYQVSTINNNYICEKLQQNYYENVYGYFSATNAANLKLENRLKRLKSNMDNYYTPSLYLVNTSDSYKTVENLKSIAAKFDIVFVFIGTEINNRYNFIPNYKTLQDSFKQDKRIKIVSLEHYFVIDQYTYKDDSFIELLANTLINTLVSQLNPSCIISEPNSAIEIYDTILRRISAMHGIELTFTLNKP